MLRDITRQWAAERHRPETGLPPMALERLADAYLMRLAAIVHRAVMDQLDQLERRTEFEALFGDARVDADPTARETYFAHVIPQYHRFLARVIRHAKKRVVR